MSTYRQLVYLVLDELKLLSDDSFYTEEHVMFMLGKYRAQILKAKYRQEREEIPQSNYQTLCLDIQKAASIDGIPCEGSYLKSTKKIPKLLTPLGITRVYPSDYFYSNVTFINKDRFRFVGFNRWLKNITYATLGADKYLYLKSDNPQMYYMDTVKMTGIFEDPQEASKLSCSSDAEPCDIMDKTFPIDDSLIELLVLMCVKELAGPAWKPKDDSNNASDDLSAIASFIARNTKNSLQKALSDSSDASDSSDNSQTQQ